MSLPTASSKLVHQQSKMLYGGADLSHGEVPPTGWEYVLAFVAPDESDIRQGSSSGTAPASAARASVLERLRHAGFAYSQLWAPSLNAVLVRLALPEATLRARAEDWGIELELLPRCGGGYLAFKEERSQDYVNAYRKGFFTPEERLRVTLDVLGSTADTGAAIDVEQLKHSGLLKDAYAIHDRRVRKLLMSHAVFERWWDPAYRPDFTRLKDYLGTRMALYFAYLGFYTRMLTGISLISVPVYFVLRNHSLPNNVLVAVRLAYGTGLVFWSAYFLKYWKRRNAILNVKWGTADFYEDSYNKIRPQYTGRPRLGFYSQGGFVRLGDLAGAGRTRDDASSLSSGSDEANETMLERVKRRFREDEDFEFEDLDTGVTFDDLPSFPYSDRKSLRRRIYFSIFMTFLFTATMLSLNFLLIFYTAEIVDYFLPSKFAPALPGILTGILIFVCDNGWKEVTKMLSKWENHRTAQGFQDSGILKRFAFQFISNYFSLFYIAFVKPFTPDDGCALNPLDHKPDCMLDLQVQLMSLVITKATIQQLLELGIPTIIIVVKRLRMWILSRRARADGTASLQQSLLSSASSAEDEEEVDDLEESKLPTYESSTEDYGELVIQYGFIALFGLAYPPAAIVCLINNLIEARSDAFKLLHIFKRVPAYEAADIGRWAIALNMIGAFSVWTNAGLITVTSSRSAVVWTDITMRSVVVFFVLKHLLFWLREAVEHAVSDIPGKSWRRRARQEYLIYRCFGIGERAEYKQNLTAQLEDLKAGHIEEELFSGSSPPNADLLAVLECRDATEGKEDKRKAL